MSTVVRKRLFALITFALSVVGSAGAASDALGPAFRIIREAVEKDEIPGAIALVARGGTILRHEAYGLRDIENRLPFTTNTLCWIASITKPVTVAAAMTLVDVGKLALDDAIEKYLPEFREQTDTNGTHHVFTIRQLMSHTSGLVPNPPTRRSGWPIGGPLDDFWLQQIFSHGWELPARLTGEGGRNGAGIPADARAKPGSGGQYIAFVPSLDLVVTRQTGSSGDWQFEEYLRRACAAVLSGTIVTIDPQGNGSSSPKTPPIGATRLRGHAPVEVTRPKHLP